MAKSWYILHTYNGYEGKIERTVKALLEKMSSILRFNRYKSSC